MPLGHEVDYMLEMQNTISTLLILQCLLVSYAYSHANGLSYEEVRASRKIQDPGTLMSQLAKLRDDKETSEQYNALAQKKLQLKANLGNRDGTIVSLHNEINSHQNDTTNLKNNIATLKQRNDKLFEDVFAKGFEVQDAIECASCDISENVALEEKLKQAEEQLDVEVDAHTYKVVGEEYKWEIDTMKPEME